MTGCAGARQNGLVFERHGLDDTRDVDDGVLGNTKRGGARSHRPLRGD